MGVLKTSRHKLAAVLPSSTSQDRFFTGLILLGLVVLMTITGALSRIDNLIYDLAQNIQHRPPAQDIVIVAIDEDSLSQLGRWPWSRKTHAQLIERLHHSGAKAIGLDILFSEPQHDEPQADQQLANAMRLAGNVVLPIVIEKVRLNGQLIESPPIPLLRDSAAGIGRVHAELDEDSIARSITLWEGIGQSTWPHFAQAMLKTAGQLPPQLANTPPNLTTSSTLSVARQDQRYVNFTTGKQNTPTLSYAQVLQGQYLPDSFQNKIVLVGSTAAGLGDNISTPISGLRATTPGVEFLANTIESMRSGTLISRTPLWINLLALGALALIPLLWLPYTSAQTGLLLTLTYFFAVLLTCMALPLYLQTWLPMAPGMLAILSAYPLWVLRKLQSATRFLDEELERLQHELQKWHTQKSSQTNSDRIQNRILQIKAATSQLIELEQQQRDVLAFVSHDIRAPIASAAAQAKQALGEQHPIYKQLSKAHNWTQEFLQTSRAQMLDPATFEKLDLIDLTHQVIDEIYPLAQERQQQLQPDLPSEPVWIEGHFDSLSRAITNLISNALKFSPPQSLIRIAVHTAAQKVTISVTDQGPGIAPDDIERIFERFSQIKTPKNQTQHGIGLGLYYVQTVAQKHGAHVSVQSQPGQTTLSIHIPLDPASSFL